ncbi:MAG TPA: ATP-binding cassette domain-containing protein [Nonomuraea sp.]|nr:ATP-binding cassette domain-containing protein [Nonomuraea sp.]
MPLTGVEVMRLTGATVGYDARPVLREVDFTLSAGEVVALLGANGSGKSTLVRALLGLLPLTGGDLRLFGVPAPRFHQRWRIGYVPQRYGAGSGVPATVREVVASGRLTLRRPFAPARAQDREAVEHAIATVGLAEKAGADVAALSGGQQRRVLIARALASDPEVLVMDEPTAGVDLANQEILAETLRRLVGTGRTLLLVAHELGPLEPLIDRVVVLDDGRITHDGPPTPGQQVHGHGHHHVGDQPHDQRGS